MKSFTEPTDIAFTKEFKGVNPNSKPRWYYTFNCPSCGKETTKVKAPNFKWLCNTCSHQKGFNTNTFIEKCKEKFKDKYTYENTIYTSSKDKVIITCPTHGDFLTRTTDFLSSVVGCPQCAREQANKKKTNNKDYYLKHLPSHISLVSYKSEGYHNKVTLNCDTHGEFTTTFGAIPKGTYVCPKCANHAHQKQSKRQSCKDEPYARMYYFYLPFIDMYKFGISTYKSSSLAGVEKELLWEKWYKYDDAINLEHLVHTELSEFRYSGSKKLIRSGNTELYKTDVNDKIIEILNRASVQQCTVESILNGGTPTDEDNPVLNQDINLVNA